MFARIDWLVILGKFYGVTFINIRFTGAVVVWRVVQAVVDNLVLIPTRVVCLLFVYSLILLYQD